MKHFLYLAASALLLITALGSCTKEPSNPVERTYAIDNFNAIEGGEQFHFTLSEGAAFSVKASGESRDVNDLVLQKSGSALSVSYSRYRSGRKRVYFTVTLPSLVSLKLFGQAQATVDQFVETVPVSLQLSGQAQCWVVSRAPKYIARAEGQSYLEFQGGSANELQLEASGQSAIYAYSLPVPVSAAVASGQSTVRTRVTQQFTANASGQSRIFFKGNPAVRIITSTGQSLVTEQ